jgi:serine/threonine protein kinase
MSGSFSQTPESMEPELGHMDALPVGTMLGEFELQGLLGVGGFGMVYRGYDHSLHRPVAIKEYMPSSLVGRAEDLQVSVKSSSDDQSFRVGLTSFIAEARLLARFDHPSLVKVYRFWEANNTAYMAMPLYQGITLKQARLQMSGPPPEVWLRTVLWSVAEALKVLHDNGTIHRDVSPDNIFLQDIGPPVLLDLGAARRAVLDRDHKHKHTAVLKVNYAPIEQYAQAKGMQEGPWTDLYALGAVIHGCLRNEAPLPATIRVVRDRMPSFFRVAQTVYTHFGTRYSPIFLDAIAHTLVIEPAHRTQSVLDFCEEMQLQVPEDLARFDWRLELGDSITLGDESQDLLVPAEDPQTMEKTLEQPHVPVVSIPRRPSRSRERRHAKALLADVESKSNSLPKPQFLMWWVMLFSTAVAVALGVAGWMHAGKSNQARPDSSQTKTPNTPSSASEYTLPPAVEPVSTVEAATPLPQVAPVASAAPVALEMSKPVPKPERRVEPIRNSSKAASSATPKTAKKEKSARAPIAVPATSPSLAEQRPTPVEAVGTAAKPVELCADATLLSRTMCIYQYCQKREFASLPVCVEDRKRWESRDRNPSP